MVIESKYYPAANKNPLSTTSMNRRHYVNKTANVHNAKQSTRCLWFIDVVARGLYTQHILYTRLDAG